MHVIDKENLLQGHNEGPLGRYKQETTTTMNPKITSIA